MRQDTETGIIYRTDYQPPAYLVDQVRLVFDISADTTRVLAQLDIRRNPASNRDSDLVLFGKKLSLQSVSLDGKPLAEGDYRLDAAQLSISGLPDSCQIETKVLIQPSQNTALEGLYQSGDFLLTQCEAEGFRKITYFPDRPDVMALYDVTIKADMKRYPVLLCNGNLVESGELSQGRHFARWVDPFPKPSYLFALVAGDLGYIEDRFTTRSGRQVTLRIYVEHENLDRCDHAMASLIKAMQWDQQRFDLEYDLDIYNVVATNDFNMGAMENKSLNIFNSKYVLARPDTATDRDYQDIEGVIGHEYFHNWTGNRVTCRDWFQLTLKEGLTVFRDQEFSADMQSRGLKRIQDVRDLRARQYPEDAGPMAHPIRPEKYIEINNFYTATVYEKGAAVIRMYHTLLGEAGFQRGMKLYFQRHDGEAVTCDDFLAAMADANDFDLSQFSRWYSQPGTPQVTVSGHYDGAAASYRLTLEQSNPGVDNDASPLLIPIAIGLLDENGHPMATQLAGEDQAREGTRILLFNGHRQSFEFINVDSRPVPSLLRDHSSPVKLNYAYEESELATLIAWDSDPFCRWEAAQRLALNGVLEQFGALQAGTEVNLSDELIAAWRGLLTDRNADPALVAEAMKLPSEAYIADQLEEVDVDRIHQARIAVKTGLAKALTAELMQRYQVAADGRPYQNTPEAMAGRSLKNVCLWYLLETPGGESLAVQQLARSDNMTDTLAALGSLVNAGSSQAADALKAFESSWSGDALVMDKWFALQASRAGADTLAQVETLLQHTAFSISNPNKVRALIGTFALANPTGFHRGDGLGYRFIADQVISLNVINPQVAARIVAAFSRWRRFDAARQELMVTELKRIRAVESLSADVYEIVASALQGVDG